MKSAFRFTLISLLFLATGSPSFAKDVEASAGGDICAVRPDLCGGAPLPKKKKVKRPVQNRAGTVNDARGNKKAKCRQKGDSYDLDNQDLPVCGSEAAKAAEEVEGDLADMEIERKAHPGRRPASQHQVRRAPASKNGVIEPLEITFESYMHANASHPAIARRPASMLTNQTAFVQPVVRSTITGSTLDQPQGTTPAPANGAAPAYAPVNGGFSGHGTVGSGQPATDGINPGDVPTSGTPAADASQGSPLR